MFITGRKVGDDIFIGDEIRVVVTEIEGGTVKIGIDAPRHVKIHVPAIEKQKKIRAAKDRCDFEKTGG